MDFSADRHIIRKGKDSIMQLSYKAFEEADN